MSFVGVHNARVIHHPPVAGTFLGVSYPPVESHESWFPRHRPGPRKFAVDERDWYEFAMTDNVIDLEAARVMRRRRAIDGNAKCVLCGRDLKPDQVKQLGGGITIIGCECQADKFTATVVQT